MEKQLRKKDFDTTKERIVIHIPSKIAKFMKGRTTFASEEARPYIMKRLNEIEELVEKTKQEGAKVLLGGKRPSGFNKGFYYEPTIFDDVKDNFTIMKQEPFGPFCPML